MTITRLQVPRERLAAKGERRATRERVIRLASLMTKAPPHEVHLVVTIDHEDGLPIELATVELNASPEGAWCLQYVSHPDVSDRLTKSVLPNTTDFAAYLATRARDGLSHPAELFCAQELADEGLGPLAALNLRPGNSFPTVPSKIDVTSLAALARAALLASELALPVKMVKRRN